MADLKKQNHLPVAILDGECEVITERPFPMVQVLMAYSLSVPFLALGVFIGEKYMSEPYPTIGPHIEHVQPAPALPEKPIPQGWWDLWSFDSTYTGWTWTERMRVTAYCAKACCCGEFADGRTASGHAATGFLVAAPPSVPLGSSVRVPGYGGGPVPVRDRGGAIKSGRLDLLFPTHQAALNWGVQHLDVEVFVPL